MIPVKVLAVIIAFMILMRFGFVFYDFLQNPFHEPIALTEEAVIHVMTGLILLELLALTLQFLVHEIIDPNIILITILTVLGRDIIVTNLHTADFKNLIAIGILLAITLAGLYLFRFRECMMKIMERES